MYAASGAPEIVKATPSKSLPQDSEIPNMSAAYFRSPTPHPISVKLGGETNRLSFVVLIQLIMLRKRLQNVLITLVNLSAVKCFDYLFRTLGPVENMLALMRLDFTEEVVGRCSRCTLDICWI